MTTVMMRWSALTAEVVELAALAWLVLAVGC